VHRRGADRAALLETLTLIDTAGIFDTAEFVKQIAKKKSGVNLGQLSVKRGRSLVDWTEGDQAFLRRGNVGSHISDNAFYVIHPAVAVGFDF
jgi:hypothetical protein